MGLALRLCIPTLKRPEDMSQFLDHNLGPGKVEQEEPEPGAPDVRQLLDMMARQNKPRFDTE